MGAKLHSQKGFSPRPSVKVPKSRLSGKGSGITQTTRRLA
jgi:hypothetical protein